MKNVYGDLIRSKKNLNPKILIVEDEGLTAVELKNKLNEYDYEILPIVSSGEDAIKKSKKLKPDLILMDIMLEGEINGIEAAKEIKTFLDIPIIYLTAFGDEETLQNAIITTPYAYILKPFQEKEVRYAIEIALYKHELELDLKEKEKQFKLLYYMAPLAYHQLDSKGIITEVNQTWLDLLGYSRDEVIGKFFGNFTLSNDFNGTLDSFNDSNKLELELLCKDKSIINVGLKTKTMYDTYKESKKILCILYNISDYKNEHNKIKESLIQKEVLLDEINSNLEKSYNKISNLINAEFKGTDTNFINDKNLDETEIKDNYPEIYEDDFALVDFAHYIESLVEDLLRSHNVDSTVDVNLNVENIMLDLNTALSYGLIVNEILKNSLNDAPFNRQICRINVDFHLSKGQFILTLSDNYNDYPEMLKSKFSSFKLIRTLVKQQHGTIGF
ncbi:MAG: response regulator, partial [Methanobacterium sp.]